MSLIKCPDCNRDVSTRAAACPNCGCPVERPRVATDSATTQQDDATAAGSDPIEEALGRVVRYLTAGQPVGSLSAESLAKAFQEHPAAGERLLKLLHGPAVTEPPVQSVALLVRELPREARQATIEDLERVHPNLRSAVIGRFGKLLDLGFFAPQGYRGAKLPEPVAVGLVFRFLVHGPSASTIVKRIVEGTFPHLADQNAEAVAIAAGPPITSIAQDVVDRAVEVLPHPARRSLLDIAMHQEGADILRQRTLTDMGFLRIRPGDSVDRREQLPERMTPTSHPGSLTPSQPASPLGGIGGCVALIVAIGICALLSRSGDPPGSIGAVANSPWDGSVSQVKSHLMATLKDPGSYESIEWSPVQETASGGFTVRHKFRAKNSFGGYVVEEKTFVLDANGKVVSSF